VDFHDRIVFWSTRYNAASIGASFKRCFGKLVILLQKQSSDHCAEEHDFDPGFIRCENLLNILDGC